MAQQALGTKLQIGANYIAELTSISGLELSADTIETTSLDSNGWRTFIQGMKDGGEVSVQGFFNSADTQGQVALYNLFNNGSVSAFTILFPSALGASWGFSGVVTAIKTGSDMEEAVSFEATIKVTGAPSLGLTASAGLSALSLTGAGGTLSPIFNNGNFNYSFGGVTATSVTVTATAANHTLNLFVDDVFSQVLTSGSASASIPLVLNIGKKITIIANESGKTAKIYEVVAIKTA